MTDFFYSQQAAELQANHDKVSATTGALKDENNTQVENRFKGNQNWNVEGSTGDPLPSSTPTTYTVGAEIAAGRFCVDADLVNATYAGSLFDADSGSYYIEYDGDFTGDFYGIKLADNTIVQTGCSISLESGKTRVTVDMSLAPAHKFLQFSENVGVAPDVSDDESRDTQSPRDSDNLRPVTASAWVNFNGIGTVSIRDSYNVSSVTDGGVGIYTVNFVSPFASSNYCAQATSNQYARATTRTPSSATIAVTDPSVLVDADNIDLAIFSN